MIVIWIIASIVSSFMNWLVSTIINNDSLLRSRSRCDFCQHTLFWFDLIPFFSFIFLAGKCRNCKHTLNKKEWFIELFFPLLIFYLFMNAQSFEHFLIHFSIAFILITESLIDIQLQIVYDTTHYLLLALTGLLRLLNGIPLTDSLTFCILLTTALYVVSNKTGGIGMGDVKLLGVLSYLLSLDQFVVAWYITIISSLTYSLFLLLKGHGTKTRIPFIPFISIGVIATLLI
ncbi:prepilin peptidase [Erysipelothrix sp. HDW6A]|uniref:prepilin peptidase n=1 Tax=Erysipelothrix sp. HDW6A TaxID=2714928 RepID=UPI00140ACF1C|nr:A24 family peptidase [Erysipelothrix sp. HDW6A]QIK57663.1 prepilin peptidase [Erysipelothrix sp. HDW6A]